MKTIVNRKYTLQDAIDANCYPYYKDKNDNTCLGSSRIPTEIDYEKHIDPGMQEIFKNINASGWVWTRWSCEHNPHLALITHKSNQALLLNTLYNSMPRIVNRSNKVFKSDIHLQIIMDDPITNDDWCRLFVFWVRDLAYFESIFSEYVKKPDVDAIKLYLNNALNIISNFALEVKNME